jgi:hypothetical protein
MFTLEAVAHMDTLAVRPETSQSATLSISSVVESQSVSARRLFAGSFCNINSLPAKARCLFLNFSTGR